MCEWSQTASRLLRLGTACLLALALCAGTGWAVSDSGRSNTPRMLIPVGHTVGVKLFARGVMVVRPPEDGTPAQTCGLEAGDVIVRCGGTAVTSTEQFQSLLQQGGDTELEVNRNGGDVKRAAELQLRYQPLIRLLFRQVSPIPIKAAMSMMGLCENSLRLPLAALDEEEMAPLAAELRRLEVLG